MTQNRQTNWNKAESGFRRFADVVRQINRDESGVTAIEYALIASLIALVIVASVGSLGTAVGAMWADIAKRVADALKYWS